VKCIAKITKINEQACYSFIKMKYKKFKNFKLQHSVELYRYFQPFIMYNIVYRPILPVGSYMTGSYIEFYL